MNQFCRTCLQIILPGEQFYNLDGDLTPKSHQIILELESLVPQITVNIIQDPKICLDCVDAVKTAYNFKKKCIEIEEKIYDHILESNDSSHAINITPLALKHHEYSPDIKTEMVYEVETVREEFSHNNQVEVKIEPPEFVESGNLNINHCLDPNKFAKDVSLKIQPDSIHVPNGEVDTKCTPSHDKSDKQSNSCELEMPRRNKTKDRFLYALGLISPDQIKASIKTPPNSTIRLKRNIVYELKKKRPVGRPRKIPILNKYNETNKFATFKLHIKRKPGRPRKKFSKLKQEQYKFKLEEENSSQELKIKKKPGRPRKIFTNLKEEQHKSNLDENNVLYTFKIKKRGRPRKIFKHEKKKFGRPRKNRELNTKQISDDLEVDQTKSENLTELNLRRNSLPPCYDFLSSTDVCKKRNFSLPIIEKDDDINSAFDCVDCDFVANPACGLGHHFANKRYECKYCNYKTNVRSYLLMHIDKHTGKKPYNCEFCKFKSAWKNSLKLHVKNRHP